MATKPNTLFDMFTATPQLKPWEKNLMDREVKSDAKKAEHILRMMIEAKALEARSKFYVGIAHSHAGSKDRADLALRDQNAAALDMIDLLDRFMAIPLTGKAGVAERRKMIREGVRAAGGSDVMGFWKDAEARWLKTLAA